MFSRVLRDLTSLIPGCWIHWCVDDGTGIATVIVEGLVDSTVGICRELLGSKSVEMKKVQIRNESITGPHWLAIQPQ